MAEPQTDILIRGGAVIDGSGAPGSRPTSAWWRSDRSRPPAGGQREARGPGGGQGGGPGIHRCAYP